MCGRFEDELKLTARVLREEGPLTAPALGERLKISKVAVYNRVRKLSLIGILVRKIPVREGSKGPLAQAFSVGPASMPPMN